VSPRLYLPALALAAVVAGCGSTVRNAAPPAGAVRAAFKGSPPPLASVHAQSDRLLPGGAQAFEARLRQLRGYPVVVNLWASWCGPCQSEFPMYQKVAVTFGRQVAFLGIDAKDANGAASAFLHRFPVTYPSYADPDGQIASAIHAFSAYPQTFYFNSRGQMVYDKAGPYLSAAELRRDIRFYLHVSA
jgi:cytochrome c biogenesis protein CcmG, thiol:disulfide interchange protein DsbE